MLRRSAMTLVDLIVLVVALALAAFVLLPIASRRTDSDQGRSYCKMSLNSIGRGMMQYRKNERMRTGGLERLPLLNSAGDPFARIGSVAAKGADSLWGSDDPVADDAKVPQLAEAPMQNVWLLIAEKFATESVFRCPGDPYWTPRGDPTDPQGTLKRYGWTKRTQVSYGLHYYSTRGPNPYPLRPDLPEDMPIMADQNPANRWASDHGGRPDPAGMSVTAAGPGDGNKVPPGNHDQGYCVLTLNGRVRWFPAVPQDKDPAGRPLDAEGKPVLDDIYTAQGDMVPSKGTDPNNPTLDTWIMINDDK